MDVDSLIKIYAHPSSILKVECDDKPVRLEDLKATIKKEDIELLTRALLMCEKNIGEVYSGYIIYDEDDENNENNENNELGKISCWMPIECEFTPEQQDKLKYLDLYLNIPVLVFFYSEINYDLFSSLVNRDYPYIPIEKFSTDWLKINAYKRGNTKELKWLLKRKIITMDEKTAANFSFHGNLKCLKYLHENECPWNIQTTYAATRNGHLECLKYAHENGCRLDEKNTYIAAENGHLECLKYLRENNCLFDKDAAAIAVQNGHLNCLMYICKKKSFVDLNAAIIASIKYDRSECFYYLCSTENMYEWWYNSSGNYSVNAACYGRPECLKYLYERGVRFGNMAAIAAAENGHLDCLKYILEKGCDLHPAIANVAAKSGHLNCLKLVVERGCRMSGYVTIYAAENGHLDCLKYALEKGCTYTPYIIYAAATRGHLDCLKYLTEIDYSIDLCIKPDKVHEKCRAYVEMLNNK